MTAIDLDKTSDARSAAETRTPAWPSAATSWAWVAVLALAYTSSFIDRQILSLLVDPIRRDLSISDTEFSLLTGLAFALFYATMGLPIGALVDRYPRRLIASVGLLCWSAATLFSGLSRSYGQILAARICVGAGESSLGPSAGSLLADSFPPHRLGRAMSVYMLGAALGAGLALILGGAIISFVEQSPPIVLPYFGMMKPWQTVFLAVGLLGLPLFLLMWVLPEPARRGAGDGAATPAWSDVAALLRADRGLFAPFLGGAACYAALTMAILSWAPAYFMRVHAMSAGDAGLKMGIATVAGIGAGLLFGAFLSERLLARGRRDGQLLAAAFGVGVAAVAAVAAFLVAAPSGTILLLGVAMCGASMPSGVTVACLQTVSPNRLRGRMTAIYLAATNMIGATLGPLLPALLADYAFGDGQRIGTAIAIVTGTVGLIGAGLFLRAARAFRRRDLAA